MLTIRQHVVLGLVHGCGLTRRLFGPTPKRQVERLVAAEWAGRAVEAYVEDTTRDVGVTGGA
uniref:hypothetical protein n=1 Tax=Nonomuraea pusilla TaxID=46177 RepID=UPI0006E25D1B|nr:hypothetical protein [Nonomuraea pusilla]